MMINLASALKCLSYLVVILLSPQGLLYDDNVLLET